jgi:hypothetical protein
MISIHTSAGDERADSVKRHGVDGRPNTREVVRNVKGINGSDIRCQLETLRVKILIAASILSARFSLLDGLSSKKKGGSKQTYSSGANFLQMRQSVPDKINLDTWISYFFGK